MGTRCRRVHGHRPLEVCKGPWSLWGSRGYAPHGYIGADGGVCRLLHAVHQTFSLAPCTAMVHGAPGDNRWGVAETSLPVKTQGRTLDCPFNFLPPRSVAGWFISVRPIRPSPAYEGQTVPAQDHIWDPGVAIALFGASRPRVTS